MSRAAAERLQFPEAAFRREVPPAWVRWGVTALAVVVAAGAGAALYRHTVISNDGARGASLYNSGDPGEAYPYLQRAVRGTRLHARPCVDLGDMAVWAIDDGVFQHFYRIGDTWLLARLAFLSYSEALEREPGSAKAWAGLAELFKKVRILRIKEGTVNLDALGEAETVSYDEEDRLVMEAYRRAVRFEPNNYFYHTYLGDFYDERGFRKEALDSYARAVEIMPDLTWHYYIPQEDVPEDLHQAALAGLDRALRTNTGFQRDRIWENLAGLAERVKDYEGAARNYQRAADSARDPSPYFHMLGVLHFTQKRYDEADRAFQRALERGTLKTRMKVMAHTLLGRSSILRGDGQKAVDSLKQARWLNPTSAHVALDLGRAYELIGRIDKAEVEYSTAIRLEPTLASAYTELIDMYRRSRQINKAIPLAKRLVEMFPDSSIFKDQLLALQRDLGR